MERESTKEDPSRLEGDKDHQDLELPVQKTLQENNAKEEEDIQEKREEVEGKEQKEVEKKTEGEGEVENGKTGGKGKTYISREISFLIVFCKEDEGDARLFAEMFNHHHSKAQQQQQQPQQDKVQVQNSRSGPS